jgi:nucleotide-binding universal stress UspA family protein
MLVNPSLEHQGFGNIVVNAEEDSPYTRQALELACELGLLEKSSWLHVVRELKLLGMLSATEQYTEEEYEKKKQSLVQNEIDIVQRILNQIPHEGLKVNIKLVSGKSGFELSQFTERKHADLLVVGAPPHRLSFLDRIFPHDLEYIFADLPCNVLVVKHNKKR